MIGDLFRKRDPVYSNGTHVSSTGLLPSALQFTAPPEEASGNSNYQHHNANTSNSDHMGLSQDSNNFNNLNTAASNNVVNAFQRIAVQEADKLSDQSNLHMPSLYGLNSNAHAPAPSVKVSDKLNCFRMVVIQDAGIRNKQPLFDSAVPNNKNLSVMQHKLNKKIHHSINELSLFMFGCYGMPISENNVTTKLHYLPALAGLSSSVLVTRLFSLDSSFELKPHTFSETTSEWAPHPILKRDELPLNENSSIRFAIGIIIPVSSSLDSIRDEITEIWTQISENLRSLQDTICSKLKQQYVMSSKLKKQQQQQQQQQNTHTHATLSSPNQHLNPSPINGAFHNSSHTKLNFSLYCLQSEVEIYHDFASFLSHIVSLVEVPRLFIDLKHSNQSLINWASTLSLWLELKDGKVHHSETNMNETYHSTTHDSSDSIKFLASLLYILLPLKDELFNNEEDAVDIHSKLRVVISTGNPIVSQKLIFIIAGILGYEKFSNMYNKFQHIKDTYKSKLPAQCKSPKFASSTTEPENNKRNVLTRNNSLFIDIPPNNTFESQSKTNNYSIPSPSISMIPANVQSQRIPVPSMNRTSSYASLQNLSSSYNANYIGSFGSQTSSNSWRNNFGSFMDRWKTSMSPSPTTSQFSQPHSHSSHNETPSPNLEFDEYPWFMMKKPSTSNPTNLSSSPAPSFISLHTSSTQQPNKFTLTNNPLISTYKANDKYEINRSTNNLVGLKVSCMKESVYQNIHSIMGDNFDYSLSMKDESVIDVNSQNDHLSDVSNPQMQLPLLVGYIPQYRPEFNMMSCPSKNLKDHVFINSMKNDLKLEAISKSRFYFINLGTKNVDFLEMKHKTELRSDHHLEGIQPVKSNKQESEGLSFKNKYQTKSNLTKTLASNYELKQSTIFTPTRQLNNANTQGIIQPGRKSIEDHVFVLDQILEKIASTINNFFYEISINSEDATSLKENECCDTIRELILELIAITQNL